eukprot:747947-Hanusia_phi.AAC.1
MDEDDVSVRSESTIAMGNAEHDFIESMGQCDHGEDNRPTSHDHTYSYHNCQNVSMSSMPAPRKKSSPLQKFILGTMKHPRIKEFLKETLRTDEDLQKGLRYITKQYLPDEVEGSVGLTFARIPNRAYIDLFKITRRSRRCHTPMKRISRRRVTTCDLLHRELKIFCTPDGAHGANLIQSVKKMIDMLGLHGETELLLAFNSDCTKLTKSSGSDCKHTEITLSIFPPHDALNPGKSEGWIRTHETRL